MSGSHVLSEASRHSPAPKLGSEDSQLSGAYASVKIRGP